MDFLFSDFFCFCLVSILVSVFCFLGLAMFLTCAWVFEYLLESLVLVLVLGLGFFFFYSCESPEALFQHSKGSYRGLETVSRVAVRVSGVC